MIFLITFVLAYSMTKRCRNCINLFPCIFVGFICNGFTVKWWRFDQDNWRLHEKRMQEGKQSGQVPTQYSLSSKVTRNLDSRLAPITNDLRSSHVLPKIVTFCIPITHTIYTHSYYIYPHYSQKWWGAYWEKNPKRGFYNTPTLLKKELFILREKSL